MWCIKKSSPHPQNRGTQDSSGCSKRAARLLFGVCGVGDVESSVSHKARSPPSSREHRPHKSKAPLLWHRPRGAVTGVHCQRQSTKKVVRGNCRRWSHAFSGPKGAVSAALQPREPSLLCIHGIQVLGLDDLWEQVVPKAEQREAIRVFLMQCSIFLSVPKPPDESVTFTQLRETKTGGQQNQSCKQTHHL